MRKRESRVLDGFFKWALRLKSEALMNAAEKRHFAQTCAPLPELISGGVIHRIRRRTKADETVFARVCRSDAHHLRDWEQGRSHPRGPQLKLIHLARKRGLSAVA